MIAALWNVSTFLALIVPAVPKGTVVAVVPVHYQLQFNENAIKSLLKTHEPIFHGHENGDSPFHGLCQAHENSIKYYMT